MQPRRICLYIGENRGKRLKIAAALLKANVGRNLRFYIVGGPNYATEGSQHTEEEIRQWIEKAGVVAHVGVIPFQKNTAPIYQALDILTHCSTEPEPFGMTIAEGLACGKPVVLSRDSGIAGLIQDGKDAITVDLKTPGALAKALHALLHDPARMKELGENARRTAVGLFHPQRLGKEIWSVYDPHLP
jgi:glycosyltransferase involved in cell wall biosynthesis